MPTAPPHKWFTRDTEAAGGAYCKWRYRPTLSIFSPGRWDVLPGIDAPYVVWEPAERGLGLPGFGKCVEKEA